MATPYFAGLVAIADQALHTRLGLINPLLYRLEQARAPGLVAVTRGSNTVRFIQNGKTVTVRGYRARARVQPGHRGRHRRRRPLHPGSAGAACVVVPGREDDHGRGCEK